MRVATESVEAEIWSCLRCKGSGSIEVVEIARSDVAYLTLTAMRFTFLMHLWEQVTGEDGGTTIGNLDRMMDTMVLEKK